MSPTNPPDTVHPFVPVVAPTTANPNGSPDRSGTASRRLDRRAGARARPPDIVRAIRSDPAARSPMARAIIGHDDRSEVANTSDYPYRCICSLLITAADGTPWIGTGWLCGPRLLLTAGHCVYVHARGGWVREIEVIPGRQGDLWPFGSCIATTLWAAEGWVTRHDPRHDYGAITLPADRPYGDELGWFGYGVRPDAVLRDAQLTVCGYPEDKPAGTLWRHVHTLAGLDEQALTYTMDTTGGQSGAPVWLEENGRPYGIGIHTYGGATSNSATRINRAVLADIERWRAALS